MEREGAERRWREREREREWHVSEGRSFVPFDPADFDLN